jgi:hypothetical protein
MLINDLIDLSASGDGKLEVPLAPVDLRQIVRNCVQSAEAATRRKNIRLDLRIDAGRGLVMGAASRLQQVVNNLLSNAIKFTPEAGEITVQLVEEKDELRLSVSDSGCGIDPESLQRLFEPFEQFDRKPNNAHGGLGLGLTIAKALAEAQHGRLTGESAGRGRGTTFTLTLPVAPENAGAQSSPAASHSAAVATSGKLQVLLVDDHEDTLRSIATLLRRGGYEVETARGLQEAEPLLARAQVLVSDIGLPDGDGWELMMRFRERGGSAGIAISGFGQEEDLRRSERAGFATHLVKPIDIDVLRREISALQPGTSA